MTPEICRELSRFLGRLADKHTDPDEVFSLRIAETGLAAMEYPQAAVPAVAIVGPTQTGKSTVVNILAGGEHVATSPLAAHTQRASVLAVNVDVDDAYPPLSPGDGSNVEVRRVESDSPPCLIWDTPDFDSNASAVYRQQVARTCALVDLVIVVLSKEKYADQSVWSVLQAIGPLETPTIICLNKCEAGAAGGGSSDADVLLPAIRRRLHERPVLAEDTSLVTLPLVPDGDCQVLLGREEAASFRALVFRRLERLGASERRAGLARLVRANWDGWVAPVEKEVAHHREWTKLVDGQTRSFLARYRAEYIDHSRHHDVARKAILGLLELLEIPSLAGPMAKTRRVLTWPFRKVLSTFGAARNPERDQELEVVEAAFDHCLLSLFREVSGRGHPWWRALAVELSEQEPEVRRRFHAAIDAYRRAFQPRIDRLSEELYQQLKSNPVTLNTLRATRLSADAGGVVLAIKTGTLGVYDALFAPAVISLTSYLTESAVGQYLRTVIAGLKREQVEQVRAVIRETLEQPLEGLQPSGPGLFGIGGSELARAREQAAELGR